MESLRIPVGMKEMLSKVKEKSLCRLMGIVASDLEEDGTGSNEGRAPVGLGPSKFVVAQQRQCWALS